MRTSRSREAPSSRDGARSWMCALGRTLVEKRHLRGELRAGAQAQLLHRACEVRRDRGALDAEVIRDLLVAVAPSSVRNHLAFALREGACVVDLGLVSSRNDEAAAVAVETVDQ